MTPANQVPGPSLFDGEPTPVKVVRNPVFLDVNGVLVYRVAKSATDPTSALMGYLFSLRSDSINPVDVRKLAGYVEPEYVRQGDPGASILAWQGQLAVEVERVIRLALANGTFIGISHEA